jgi:peroxiredoxin
VISLAAQQNPFGTAVGAKIPDFSAPDQNGVSQRFETIKGAKGAMLVFFRSADW